MKTVLKDWFVVSIVDGLIHTQEGAWEVLWGIVVEDNTDRFPGDGYCCTSRIYEFDQEKLLIQTVNGSIYQLVGFGQSATVDLKVLKQMRAGCSPAEINSALCKPWFSENIFELLRNEI